MELRAKIEGLCELRGWSVRRVNLEAGLSQSSLLHAMNGHAMGVGSAIRVARVLDVAVEWLFDPACGWGDLERMPFWMPPGIDPQEALGQRRESKRKPAPRSGSNATSAARKKRPRSAAKNRKPT